MTEELQKFINRGGFSPQVQIHLLPQSGSNRKFYRVKESQKSAILIQSEPQDGDFTRYIEIGIYLRRIGVAVPEIYYWDKKRGFILEEDLGDLTLQSYIVNGGDLDFYKKVINELLLMQIEGWEKISMCECLKERLFDYDTFRWESWYFTKYFVEMYCRLKNVSQFIGLQQEFHRLAMKLVDEPLYFMHRDFQSQNILLKDGKVRVVDFQGARKGLLVYDLASLLKDAYVTMEDEMREELIDYYLTSLNKRWKINLNPEKFRRVFLYAGLQRNMQALGAFSFLTLVKHKPQFAQYIPNAVEYLHTALKQTQEFAELLKIVELIKFKKKLDNH